MTLTRKPSHPLKGIVPSPTPFVFFFVSSFFLIILGNFLWSGQADQLGQDPFYSVLSRPCSLSSVGCFKEHSMLLNLDTMILWSLLLSDLLRLPHNLQQLWSPGSPHWWGQYEGLTAEWDPQLLLLSDWHTVPSLALGCDIMGSRAFWAMPRHHMKGLALAQ